MARGARPRRPGPTRRDRSGRPPGNAARARRSACAGAGDSPWAPHGWPALLLAVTLGGAPLLSALPRGARAEEPPAAAAVAEPGKARDPDAWALYLRANHLSNEGRCAEALELFEQALLLSPSLGEILLARARCLEVTGQREAARESLTIYLALGLAGKEEAAVRAHLESLGPSEAAPAPRADRPVRGEAGARAGIGWTAAEAGATPWVNAEATLGIRVVGPLGLALAAGGALRLGEADGPPWEVRVEAGAVIRIPLGANVAVRVGAAGTAALGGAGRDLSFTPAVRGSGGFAFGPDRPGALLVVAEGHGGARDGQPSAGLDVLLGARF